MALDVALLWMDCETTGLLTDPRMPTILEGSWTVTDTDGTQVTALQQAFTAIAVDGGDPVTPFAIPADPRVVVANPGALAWLDEDYPLGLVRDMHDRSGLTREWVDTKAQAPHRVLRHGAELDRLLLDYLHEDGVVGAGTRLYLAGAGVAHMEHRILPMICPRVAELLYYHVVDVSGFLRVHALRQGKGQRGTVEEYLASLKSGDVDPWISLETDPARHDALLPSVRGRGGALWRLTGEAPHRSSPDVAAALMVYRSLRDWSPPDREAVSDPHASILSAR